MDNVTRSATFAALRPGDLVTLTGPRMRYRGRVTAGPGPNGIVTLEGLRGAGAHLVEARDLPGRLTLIRASSDRVETLEVTR